MVRCGKISVSTITWKDGTYIYCCEDHEKEIRKISEHFGFKINIETMGELIYGCEAKEEKK